MKNDIFSAFESEVRIYCRQFPAVFHRSIGSSLFDESGREYIDFLSGAGALNYGHNHPAMVQALIQYLQAGGLLQSLDLHTTAKRQFLELLYRNVIEPRKLNYKVQFTGPTGSSAVEAALKLARRITGRQGVVAFTNAYHGMSLGALSATGNRAKRAASGLTLTGVSHMPFDNFLGNAISTAPLLDQMLTSSGSGVDLPAAIILETIQAEGGVNVASKSWLQHIAQICVKHEIMLVVDEIQTGCGRTGPFFSFEDVGIAPDIVCLSKSIGGAGLPMALVLFKAELDQWQPGEHTGTFRGNNLAFVAGAIALDLFWASDSLEKEVRRKGDFLREQLEGIAAAYPEHSSMVRGRGLLQAIAWDHPGFAMAVSRSCFEKGLVVETCGPNDHVLKLLPPLTIADEALSVGVGIIREAIATTQYSSRSTQS